MDLVSVILPTYNVENYLYDCLVSVSKQTYENIEIICVIDGATDNSLQIAQEFAKNDSRVKVIYQENAGSGPARNNGLRNANGKYIVFVDPDDWIEMDLVEKLVEAQSGEFDLVLSGYIAEIYENNKITAQNIISAEEVDYSFPEMRNHYFELYNNGLLGSPTKKLYLKKIIEDYEIEFPDLRRSQDIVFNYRYFDKCKSVKISNYAGYHYRIEPKDRLLRLKEDYYKTLNIIVNDIRDLHSSWGIELSDSKLANNYVYLYLACLEANIVGNRDINCILEDEMASRIICTSTLSRPDIRVIRYGVRKKKVALVIMVIKIRYYIKLKMNKW